MQFSGNYVKQLFKCVLPVDLYVIYLLFIHHKLLRKRSPHYTYKINTDFVQFFFTKDTCFNLDKYLHIFLNLPRNQT